MHWAIDLGTTHTRVARWDSETSQPRLLELERICRRPNAEDPLEAPFLIPSATHVLRPQRFRDRLGAWSALDGRFLIGSQALIGRQALEKNEAALHPNFAPSFKIPLMSREALLPLVRTDGHSYTVREVARAFLRELLVEIRRSTGERIRDVALTVPVEAYETYRAELSTIAKGLGVRRIAYIDEPVAAALGYGLNLAQDRVLLVVDFGGGTLHMVVTAISHHQAEAGHCRVLAKTGSMVGGNLVDQWLLDDYCRRQDIPLLGDQNDDEISFWHRQMLGEARRVKEALFFREATTFRLVPPASLRIARGGDIDSMISHEVTRDDLIQVLRSNGLYKILETSLDELGKQIEKEGIQLAGVDEVLLVGGSTLLPGVYPLFEERFGRDRVRGWQPFEAVVLGACAFASEGIRQSDFIVHDYAFVTHDPETRAPQYTVVVPRNTRFPTSGGIWKRQLVPTCSLGEPERYFKLLICEIGRASEGNRTFVWDASGTLHKLGDPRGKDTSEATIVPLNESNPTLGYLDPPHPPGDRGPRLEVSFSVNEDRWLCATVIDLWSKRSLMRDEPVVRLL